MKGDFSHSAYVFGHQGQCAVFEAKMAFMEIKQRLILQEFYLQILQYQ